MAELTLGQAADAVLAALDEFGWCQSPDVNRWRAGEKVPICLGIAFQEAMKIHEDSEGVFASLHQRIMRLIWKDHSSYPRIVMVSWNDDPSTSEEDVRLLVKKAGHDV